MPLEQENKMYDVVIVGAGAAGLLCAGFLKELDVVLVDKNRRPARKVLITGKGRCNLTNDCEVPEFLSAVRRNPRFLYSALSSFPPASVMALLEELGVPLKTERGNRVFPVSDKAMDIVDALARHARRAQYLTARCAALLLEEHRVAGVVLEDGTKLYARTVLIATGGLSYPRTGSDGDGYRLARQAGHTVTPLRPSLVPIHTREKWVASLAGLGLKNIRLDILKKNQAKPVYSAQGELLFTHTGLSGPLILSASAHMEPQEMGSYTALIDLKPALSFEVLDARLLRDFAKFSAKEIGNALHELIPRALIPIVLEQAGMDAHVRVNQLTQLQRRALVQAVKGIRLTPASFASMDEAVVTSGGVDISQIDPKTMRSKLIGGLYFAGEVLDVDAYTGGYNLQIAFSTGRAAARGIQQEIGENQ